MPDSNNAGRESLIKDLTRSYGDVAKMPENGLMDTIMKARGSSRAGMGAVLGKAVDDGDRMRIENIKNVLMRTVAQTGRRATNAGLGLADINPRDYRLENAMSQSKTAEDLMLRGFVDRCSDLGIDPSMLVKMSQAAADADTVNDKNDIFKGTGIVPGKTGYPDATPPLPPKSAPPPPPKKVVPPVKK
jgi:hypothetical protein